METAGDTRASSGFITVVLLVLVAHGVFAREATAQRPNHAVIEGSVKHGEQFAASFGRGFTFRLTGRDVWVIEITHTASGDRDLVYPVNPPYRFSNRQYIGPGYGESARDSAQNTPREFAFLYRSQDVEQAWKGLERVLWPYNYSEAEVQKATDELARFPTGTLSFEIVSAEFANDPGRPEGERSDEFVRALKFRATISWPGTP